MTNSEFTAIVAAGSIAAGFLGALTGLGGGAILIPLLTLGLGVDIRYAIGAALTAVIATSSGAASAYVRDGLSNVRIGMFLEVATSLGATAGAWLAIYLHPGWLGVVFGLVLIQSAWFAIRADAASGARQGPLDVLALRWRLHGSYSTAEGVQSYSAANVVGGFSLMGVAGLLSGLLGVGSGSLKVIAMDRVMGLPFKVSTTTSNFMIGVTAATSAGVYLHRGYIDPLLCMPIIPGILLGAWLGARVLPCAPVTVLRRVFAGLLLLVAVEMIRDGLGKASS